MATARPLRTSMYVPGNKEDWMRKAPQYGSDALILDLEDSVPVPNKSEARVLGRKMLEEMGGEKPTLTVRVNRLETGLTGGDLEAITCPQLYCVLLPKVESAADVVEVDNLLSHFERKVGMEVGTIFIDPGMETATSIRLAYEIASASPRVAHMGGSGGKGGAARARAAAAAPLVLDLHAPAALALAPAAEIGLVHCDLTIDDAVGFKFQVVANDLTQTVKIVDGGF